MSYGIEIRQSIGSGLEQEESLAKYKVTLQALVRRHEDAAEIDIEDEGAMFKFLKAKGIEVRWYREG